MAYEATIVSIVRTFGKLGFQIDGLLRFYYQQSDALAIGQPREISGGDYSLRFGSLFS